MNIFGACIIFLVLIVVFLIITEVYTVLFRFTGLPAEKARFQVTSLLTNCGFTTKESEIILSTPRRRHLARYIMLFGYAFTVSIVSAMVNLFLSLKESQIMNILFAMPIVIAPFLIFLLLRRSVKVREWVNHRIEDFANKLTFKNRENHILLLDYIGGNAIAQVDLLQMPEELKEVSLRNSRLKDDFGVLVMLVERRGGTAAPMGADDFFSVGDRLVVCGEYDNICRAFHADARSLERQKAVL